MFSDIWKRSIFFSTLWTLFIFHGEARAMEVFLAKVISITPSMNKIVVSPLSENGALMNGSITVKLLDGALPPCIQTGRVIKLWGDFSTEDPTLFLSTRISGMGGGPNTLDGTGVRRRLGKDSDSDTGGGNSGGGGHGGKGGGGKGGGGGRK